MLVGEMETPMPASALVQIAFLVGLPVHAVVTACGMWLLRSRRKLSWPRAIALAPAWLLASLALQIGLWIALPDLPEPWFMMLGVINLPALVGACCLLAASRALLPAKR